MKASVTIDRLDPPDKIIRLEIVGEGQKDSFDVSLNGPELPNSASGYLSAAEAYQLGLELLAKVAQEKGLLRA